MRNQLAFTPGRLTTAATDKRLPGVVSLLVCGAILPGERARAMGDGSNQLRVGLRCRLQAAITTPPVIGDIS